MKYKHPNLRYTPSVPSAAGDPYWANVIRRMTFDNTLTCAKTGLTFTPVGSPTYPTGVFGQGFAGAGAGGAARVCRFLPTGTIVLGDGMTIEVSADGNLSMTGGPQNIAATGPTYTSVSSYRPAYSWGWYSNSPRFYGGQQYLFFNYLTNVWSVGGYRNSPQVASWAQPAWDSSDYNLILDGNYTLELWANRRDNITGNTAYIYATTVDPEYYQSGLVVQIGLNDNLVISSAFGNLSMPNQSFPLQTWAHIAICKNGSTTKVYLNGTEVLSTAAWGTIFPIRASSLEPICVRATGIYSQVYVDDIRLTKGIARYTSNFAVPTQPYPTS
jgi:hypothetical protein